MILYRFLISFFLAIILLTAAAQDTLTVMHYNLLNYGVITDYCDNNNNNINNKDSYLRTILDYHLPDIFTVNEISESENIHQRLLDNVLNSNDRYYFRKASFLSQADSRIVNMLYYNSRKLAFYSHTIAQNYIRDIDVYTLYYRASDLAMGDTVFIHCIVAHLKAGDGTLNSNKRNIMVSNTLDYLDDFRQPGNYLFMGDFNIYTDEEPAYTKLRYFSNPEWQFNDPIDRSGPWSNNPNYSDIHTQSTKSSSNGCAAPGGMDDRFDFIMTSPDIDAGNKNVKYMEGSYLAMGQDGQHFNKSIIASPTNTSVPNDVLYALFYNSDHLPVSMKIIVDKVLDIHENRHQTIEAVRFENPVSDQVILKIRSKGRTLAELSLLGISGQVLKTVKQELHTGENEVRMVLGGVRNGFYLIRIKDSDGNIVVKKLVTN